MEFSSSSSSYFEYVRSLCPAFPRLQLLADFMSNEVWIEGFHTPNDVEKRMKKVDVTSFDLGIKSPVAKTFTDFSTLEAHLNSEQEPKATRVLFVEDISRDVIELLGSKFRLEPQFFENHLRGIQRFLAQQWMGDKTLRLECSLATRLKRNFFTISFRRPYQFDSWESLIPLRRKLNIPRIGSVVHNLYLRERVSVYSHGDKSTSKYYHFMWNITSLAFSVDCNNKSSLFVIHCWITVYPKPSFSESLTMYPSTTGSPTRYSWLRTNKIRFEKC